MTAHTVDPETRASETTDGHMPAFRSAIPETDRDQNYVLEPSRRLRLLISAYAFRPDLGSEPGIGWHLATEAARRFDVWVITPEANRHAVDAELTSRPVPNLQVVYHDLEGPSKWLASIGRSAKIHDYRHMHLWHFTAKQVAVGLHNKVAFDFAHHATYGSIRNWSYLPSLGIPFIWGPVGGGEQASPRLLQNAPLAMRAKELVRSQFNSIVRFDPLVRQTARSATVVLATTQDSADRLPSVARARAIVMQNIGIDGSEIPTELYRPSHAGFKLLFVGRLLYWKGVDLAIEALQRVSDDYSDVSLTIVGDGPERNRLINLATRLGLSERVTFAGNLQREQTLELFPQHDSFIFPSLHDSGGFAVLEAMASRLPVICLNTGGPAITVTDETGFRIDVSNREMVIGELASCICALKSHPQLRDAMGSAGRQRVISHYLWEHTGSRMEAQYAQLKDLAS